MDEVYYGHALSYARDRRPGLAARYARKAAQLNPENRKARILLGVCLYELGDIDGALGFLDASAELMESAAADLARLRKAIAGVRYLAKQGKLRKADLILGALKHQSVRVLTIRGCLHAAAGRYRTASVFFSRALDKDKGNIRAAELLSDSVVRSIRRDRH